MLQRQAEDAEPLNFSPARLTQLHLNGETNVQGQCQTLGNTEQLQQPCQQGKPVAGESSYTFLFQPSSPYHALGTIPGTPSLPPCGVDRQPGSHLLTEL